MLRLSSKLTRATLLASKTLQNAQTARQQSTGGRSGTKLVVYTVGSLALVTTATLAYAKHDAKFRKMLNDTIPGTDTFMKVVFEEDNTYSEQINAVTSGVGDSITGLLPFGGKEDVKVVEKPARKTETVEKRPEVPAVTKTAPKPAVVEESSKVVAESPKPRTLYEIETHINQVAKEAIKVYEDGAKVLNDFVKDVEKLVSSDFEQISTHLWETLRRKSQQKMQAITQAESLESQLQTKLSALKTLLNNHDFDASEELINRAKRNVSRVENEIDEAKRHFADVINSSGLTDLFWEKIAAARRHYAEELAILCPSIAFEGKLKGALTDDELDLFLMHAKKQIARLQTDLARLETKRDAQLKQALASVMATTGESRELVEEVVNSQIEKERRKLMEEFERKVLELHANSEKELRNHLRRLTQVHTEHLNERLQVKDEEIKRASERKVEELVEKERLAFKAQLSAMVGHLRGIDDALKARADADQNAHKAQILWSACQALHSSIKNSIGSDASQNKLRNVANEVQAISKAAADGDELVRAVLASIPSEAIKRGVYPEDALRERFLKVETVAKRLALVPENGGKLPTYLLSYVQSTLLTTASPISNAELRNEAIDHSQLDTSDILLRARYWLDRGDFAQTLRYMNLLNGAPRAIADEWMNETRILLETQQAANTLMAHAAACGLIFL